MEFETIDVRDEKAKELAQILANETSLLILGLLQEKTLSMSEIARELGIPMSTVSYHIDKMVRVGLVEIAGKKYGKRLQEVKLYRAASKPILLLPRGMPVKKRFLRVFEKIQIISLGIAGLLASGVYVLFDRLLQEEPQLVAKNATYAIERAPSPGLEGINKTVTSKLAESSPIPYILAILVFVVGFFLVSRYLMKKKI
ncbi:ArsR family transcriptional regulator [Thermococcus litoralis DSM 5473]|uniref:ArsR family transcriptional regulator n=1 Tax=Thermococcus litoralis (strain ATCC 51850 / DSM 5473 / JCM 8560 / NS-C) TaxID=523849 RepID=H3ZLT4_THELN|nr:helix-turn-helix domain-containing protein [Thermococcus litoralis]EHR79086.1 ArsR family transcriptional regulator [Thermococcus litoralis DSM 5473]